MSSSKNDTPGHRELSGRQLSLIGRIREAESVLADLYREVGSESSLARSAPGSAFDPSEMDCMRQLSIARTELESGFMRLVRAVARPKSPWVV